LFLIAVLGISCYTENNDEARSQSADNAAPSLQARANTAQTANDQSDATSRPKGLIRLVSWPQGVGTLLVGLTLFFIAWQAFLTRQAIVSADTAARIELRAYLGVTINTGCYQEREKQIRFEGTPALVNNGKTPAHKVRYRSKAAVLREPIPPNYFFTPEREEIGEYVVGTNNSFTLHIVVDDYFDQLDVPAIMEGNGRALYYWGIVTYEDVFGDVHDTEFCHRIYFYPNLDSPGKFKVNGTYLAGKNKAT
jgi:hypothetical protein